MRKEPDHRPSVPRPSLEARGAAAAGASTLGGLLKGKLLVVALVLGLAFLVVSGLVYLEDTMGMRVLPGVVRDLMNGQPETVSLVTIGRPGVRDAGSDQQIGYIDVLLTPTVALSSRIVIWCEVFDAARKPKLRVRGVAKPPGGIAALDRQTVRVEWEHFIVSDVRCEVTEAK